MSRRASLLTLIVCLAAACRVVPPSSPSTPPSYEQGPAEPRARARLAPGTVPPYAPSSPVGFVEGQFSVDGNGAATFELPIDVPPGTAGVQPDLSLSYNHHRENGYVGMGWQLNGLSAIGRCGATYALDGFKAGVAFDAGDRFCLDGQRLMAVSGTYGADGTVYHTANETQTSVISHGSCGTGPCSFTAYNKDGDVLSFAGSTDSRILAQGRTDGTVRAWALNRHTDTNDNYTSVTYVSDAATGEYYPVHVDYTGNTATGLEPQRRIDFAYTTRTDDVRRYLGGSLVQVTKLLERITTSVSGQTVQTYTLGYDTSAFTQRARLQSVTNCDGAGVCLPPFRFTWQTEGGDFATAAQLPGPLYVIVNNQVFPLGVLQDFNGDGIADYSAATEFVTSTTKSDLAIWFGRPDGSFVKSTATLPGPVFRATSTAVAMTGVLQDINGDAILDFSPATYYASTQKSDLSVWLGSTGGTFTKASFTLPDALYFNANNQTFQSGVLTDLNGDGIPDYSRATRFTSSAAPRLDIWKGTGTGFTNTGKQLPGAVFLTGSTTSNRVGILQDINGDGIADYSAASASGSNACDCGVYTGATPDFTFTRSFDLPAQMLWNVNGRTLDTGVLVDLNGDGLPDYSRATEIAGGASYLDVYLGTGTGFVDSGFDLPGPVYLISNNTSQITGVLTEINGDGTSRYSRATKFPDGREDLDIYLGSGEGFDKASFSMPEPLFQRSSTIVYAKGIYQDVNGDGMTDFANTTCTMTSPGVFTNCSLDVDLARGPFSDLLATVTNSFGGVTSASYAPISDPAYYSRGDTPSYPVRDAQSSIYVLTRYASSDARGASYAFSYTYSGARTDVLGRDWIGFTTVTQKEDAGGRAQTSRYSMTFPFYGLATHTEVKEANGTILGTTDSTYADFAPQSMQSLGVHQPLQTAFVDTTYQDGSPAFHVARNWDYDQYGNPTIETEVGDPATNVLPVHHCVRYRNDAAPDVNRLGYELQRKSTRTLEACTAFLAVVDGNDVQWDPATDLRWAKQTWDGDMNLLTRMSYDDSHSAFAGYTYTVDEYGNTRTLANATGAATTVTFDSTYHSFVDTITYPALTRKDGTSYTLSTSYVAEPRYGVIVQTIDANGNTMRQDVDGFGRPVAQWGPDAAGTLKQLVSTLWYSDGTSPYLETRARPSWSSTDDPSAWYWQRTRYDGLAREYRQERSGLQQGTPKAIVQETRYDAQGRVHQQLANFFEGDTAPILTTEYDSMNRPILTTDPSGVKERIVYEQGGLKVTLTQAYDTPEASTSINYIDVEGRTRQRVAENGQSLTFGYDPLGQIVSLTSAPLSRPATIAFDSLGRVRSLARADTGTTTWTYDATTLLRRIADASGNSIAFDSYDALQRVVQRTATYSGKSSVWSYTYDEASYRNGLGHPTTVVIANPVLGTATYHYAWNAYDQASSGELTLGGTTYTYGVTHDPLGRPVERVYPDGAVATSLYGADGNPSRIDVTEPGEITARTYATLTNYTAEGQLQDLSLDQNGVQVARRYYPNDVAFGKLRTIDAKSTRQSNASLVSLTYAWNELNEVTSIADANRSAQSQTFGYDNQPLNKGMGFLTSATGGYGTKSFEYEQLGNITKLNDTTFAYKPGTDHIASNSDDVTWRFGTNGFIEKREDPAAKNDYSFDADGNLVGILQTPPQATGTTTLQAGYDHTGRKLMQQTAGGPTVWWATDAYEVDDFGNGHVQHTRYILGPYGPIASITADGTGVTGSAGAAQRARVRAMMTGRATLTGRAESAMYEVLAVMLAPQVWRGTAMALVALLLMATVALMTMTSRRHTAFARLHLFFARIAPVVALCVFAGATVPAYADLSPGGNGSGVPAAGRRFFVQNLVNSTISVTDDAGDETARVAYQPYGAVDQPSSSGTDDFRWKFGGKDYDATNGLYDFLARRYDPMLGRFVSPDPKNQYVSPYLYGGSDPVSMLDPDGEFAFLAAVVVGAVVGAYFGAVAANGTYNPLHWNWQSGKTWAGIFGGAAIGAVGAAAGGLFVEVGVAVGSLGGTAAQVAGVAIGIAGQSLVGAGENAAFTALGGGTPKEIVSSAAQGAVFGAIFGAASEGMGAAGSRLARSGESSLADDLGAGARRGDADQVRSRDADAPCSCGCSSFIPGTRVTLADGSLRPIETVTEGDQVAGSIRGLGTSGTVSTLLGRETREFILVTLASGEEIHVTPEHPFYVERRGWIPAKDLGPGFPLATASGTPILVDAIEPYLAPLPVRVHNLEVDTTHDYYVGDARVLVHNGKYCKASIDSRGVVTETWNKNSLKKRYPDRLEYKRIKSDIIMKARKATGIVKSGKVKAYTRVKNPVKTASKEWVRAVYAQYFPTEEVPASIRAGLKRIRTHSANQDVDEYLTRIQGGLTIREGLPENQGPLDSFVNSTSGAAMGALSRAVPVQPISEFAAAFSKW